MTLIAIVGELGEGKTLGLTYLAFWNKVMKNKNIYANYHLKNIPYTHVNTLEQLDKIKQGMFFADELWFWIDCRASKNKRNKFISDILLKSRKRGFHIFYTTQRFGQIDIRVREITDFLVSPKLSRYVKLPNYDEQVPLLCTLEWYTLSYGQIGSLLKTMRFYTMPIFNCYDTTEEIEDIE